ncbi:hypothetical protein GGX14DRAFT_403477 [Mycena pura]|uniref:Uncharacterized protein n=1 Tax=Mycena pura TaxID=153505 RepID=A0AAD6UY00_9AGAR|nr:hypothetical protein GGX14DRAFT_403477 [Mycena pura]
MPPKRSLPECYEERASDKKVRCKVCTNASWAAYAKVHVTDHINSAKHKQAVDSIENRRAGQTDIEQRLAGVPAAVTVERSSAALTLTALNLPTFQPSAQRILEAEADMWRDYNKYDAGFSAGDEISEAAAQQRIEREMDMMGVWDAVEVGRQLDGQLDEVPNPAAEDNALLNELLEALDSDPFDATLTQTDSEKSSEWYPYPSKTMLLLDICDNLPRLPVSESLMRTFIWILKECGAKDVPSLDALRKTQKTLRSQCGIPTIPCTSVQGKNFCINDPTAIIRMECANPEIRSQFHLYPEINTNGSISQIWHGEKICKALNPTLLTPMFDAGNGFYYYTDEVALLQDGRFVIPFRWIKVDGIMHADAHVVETDEQGLSRVMIEEIRVPASLLVRNFLDLECENRVPIWSEDSIQRGYPARMPNPLRAIAKGDPFYTIFVDYFSDDVSGNRSKSWNKHWNAYMTNRALPRDLLQHEFYVHFLSTSQHASIPEQFKEFKQIIQKTESDPIRAPDKTSSTGRSCYRVIVNTDPSDNPMQAEICSCMGATANYPCRKCKAGGTQEDKMSNEGYHAMFVGGEPRTLENVFETIQHQLNLACEGNETDLKKSYTATGIKDKYTEYWINDILSQFKKAVANGEDKQAVTEVLKQWVKDHSDDIYSAFLTTDGFDPSRDTPIELLHTILLGVLKYLWHTTHTAWTAEQKKLFELRLQATNTSGLSIEGIRAGYIVQYANSLIGRQFKVVLQSTVFQIHDMADENRFRAWKAIGDLAPLLWFTEIDNMEVHCADLHVAIANFLDSFAEIDPSKMITKVKTHLLAHAPADVRMFGPLLGAITEVFESFNAVFRGASILSNHRAPSRDIAVQLAYQEGIKHRVAGGQWPVQGPDGEIIWTHCGPSARRLLQEHPILQRLLGWKNAAVLQPGSVKLAAVSAIKGQRGRPQRETVTLRSTAASLAFNAGDHDLGSAWYRCQSVISQSEEVCSIDSWVMSSSPVPNEAVSTGRITEILQKVESTEVIIILQQYVVQPGRHTTFNMPFLSPRRREEAVYLILNPENIKFSFNAQHDCSGGTCKASGKRPVLQERCTTQLEESFIEHDPLVPFYIINTASLHNPHLLRRTLPSELIKPTPLWEDRVGLHQQQAERLRSDREVRKIKNAAAAKARKAANTAAQPGSQPEGPSKSKRKRPADNDEDRQGPSKRRKPARRRYQEESDSSDESGADSGSESGLEDEVTRAPQKPLPSRRPGLRVRVSTVNYVV